MNGSPPASCSSVSRTRSALWYLVVMSLLFSLGLIEQTFKENALNLIIHGEDNTLLPRGGGGLVSQFSLAGGSSSIF